MKRVAITKLILLLCVGVQLHGQDVYKQQRVSWLQKAQTDIPQLHVTIKKPLHTVQLKQSASAFQGWTIADALPTDSLFNKAFDKQKPVVLDFGEHITGYFSFRIGTFKGTPDAPVRLKFTFGEVPSEVATPFDPYKGGLSRAWLQDEVVTITEIPSEVKIDRRLAFRYVKIELLGAGNVDFKIGDVSVNAVSSAGKQLSELKPTTAPLMKKIDEVGLNTLKECMQTVYEDGPKRDRRLWAGDLYLQSLANDYSFKNYGLTKRCLYLLASLSGENGYVIATVFEKPEPHPQSGQFLLDYCFLYNAALRNYVDATSDTETGNDLWPVAKKQIDIIRKYLLPNGLMDYEKANKEWWIFFDWKDGLDKQAGLQGISVFALEQTYALAKKLHKENELADVPGMIAKIRSAAKKQLYDVKTGIVFSGSAKQISYASQIWFALSGILNQKEAKRALSSVVNAPGILRPNSPYLYHYYVQALIDADMPQQARETVLNYWGGMVNKGADTFWEVYDPNNDYLSPYNFFPINSYCHAWSCTPVYFIRKYPKVFQQ